jgi:type I restriction enzyme S subunit
MNSDSATPFRHNEGSTTSSFRLLPSSFKPYPAYKPSGIEWLGEIPEHWRLTRIKHVAHIDNSGAWGNEPEDRSTPLPVATTANIDVEGNLAIDAMPLRCFSEAEERYYKCQRGDIVVVKSSGSATSVITGKAALIKRGEEGIVFSNFLMRLRPYPALTVPSLLFRFVSSGIVKERIKVMVSTTTYPNLRVDEYAGFEVPLGDLSEQCAIADFLDRETAKIDALIAKKERLVELLQEKRTALISHAVTKGLDPTVPMKDSGIEWLGEIPAHWQLIPAKRRSRRIQTGSTPPTDKIQYYEEGVTAWFAPGSFGDDLLLKEPAKLISQRATKDGVARMFEAGSSLIVCIGATIGKVGYIESPASSNQQITAITFDITQVLPRFGAYQLKRLEPVLRGIAPNTTLPILDTQEIACLPLALPPLGEQQTIIEYLDRETSKIDTLNAKIREAIERLKEYRTALISAAVTGKIDARKQA